MDSGYYHGFVAVSRSPREDNGWASEHHNLGQENREIWLRRVMRTVRGVGNE
jgi:hypothetical protein